MNFSFNTGQVGSLITSLANKAKALALNVSEIELKVLEATNEEPWGPHGQIMSDIVRAAENPENYHLVMNVLSERLSMRDENWRLCYKALLVLEYMVKRGPLRVADELQRSVSSLERLRDNFEYKDAQGRDQGINVRQRAGELAALVSNPERVRAEREKARQNANKYKGVSSDDMKYGGFGGGGYGSGSGSAGGSNGGGFRSSGFGSGGGSAGGSNSSMPGGAAAGARAQPDSGAAQRRSAAGEEEDPFEATRKRIERLKAEGALPDPPLSAPVPGVLEPPSTAKQPKKLKDVKINPAVAATFAGLNITPASSTSSLGKLTAPVAPSTASNSAPDLLADLEVPTPQPGPASAAFAQASSSTDWDAFGDIATATSQPQAAVAAPASAPAQPLDFFSGFDTSTAAPVTAAPASAVAPPSPPQLPASAQPAASQPLPMDFFGGFDSTPASTPVVAAAPPAPPKQQAAASNFMDFGMAAPAPPQQQAAPAIDLFAGFSAPVAPAAPVASVARPVDPFAASTPAPSSTPTDPFSVLAGTAPAAALQPGSQQRVVKLGEAPAKSNDPFADLTGL